MTVLTLVPCAVQRLVLASAFALLGEGSLQAQATTPRDEAPNTRAATRTPPVSRDRASPGGGADSVQRLSPFVVNSTQDTGYQASSTLAGTRLNTPLADLGAAISVYTKSFLEDLGATDAQFLIYATGMEAAGAMGNFSGATGDINATEVVSFGPRADPQQSTRTRGLATPGFTRGYFTTNVAMDSYNTERVTVARGPNAMLFGVGSPAGVVDTSLLLPDLIRDRNSITFRYGNNDSRRFTVDFNRTLIREKLALRVAALHDREQFDQRPAFEEKRRVYGAVTYAPFRSTSIRANFESGRAQANRPLTVLPLNNISRFWFDAGRPSFDWSFYDDPARNPNAAAQSATLAAAAFGPGFLIGSTGAIIDQIVTVYNNPGDRTPAYAFRSMLNNTNASQANVVKNQLFQSQVNRDQALDTVKFLGTLDPFEIPAGFWTGANVLPGQQPGFSPAGIKKQGFTNFDAFDFRNRMIDETARQGESFRTFNVALEQRAWRDRIGVELAYDTQRVDRRTRMSFLAIGGDSPVRIDPNVTLPTGQPNPNLGRPYVTSGNTRYTNVLTEREAKRLTAYFAYDFKDWDKTWGKWLGRHTVSGVREDNLIDTVSYNPQFRMDGPLARELNPVVNAGNRVPAIMVYIGPSIIGNNNPLRLEPIRVPQPANGPLGTVTSFVREANDTDPGHFENSPTELTTFINAGTLSRERIKSSAATLQSYWLNEHVITAVGWRRDEDYFARRAVNFIADPANPNNPGKTVFGFDDLHFPSTPPPQTSQEIKSYSVVLRWPKELIRLPAGTDFTIFYNQSENFTPSGDRVTPYGEKIAPPRGKTTEHGFNLSAFHDKLVLRVSRFETSVERQSFSPGVFGTANVPAVVGLVANWALEGNTNPHLVAMREADIKTLLSGLPSNYLDLYGYKVTGTVPNLAASYNTNLPGQSDTTDFTAKGTEFELVFNPTSNWRVMLNAAKQETIQTNQLPWMKRFLAVMTPIWKQLGDRAVARYPTGWQPGDPFTTDTVASYIDRNIMVPFATAIATEGSASAEQRKWRANLVANYTFGRGSPFERKLRGFGIGGAVRWQDKLGLGYPTTRKPDGSVSFDLAHPYYAPALTNVDAWLSYTAKFWNDRINWRVQLNVSNLYGDRDPVPIGVQPWGEISTARLAPERRWYLSNKFSF
jgi:outer membrane receptor protein involved in Fe transport